MTKPTATQLAMLKALSEFERSGRPATLRTLRQVTDFVGYSSTDRVERYLIALERKGLVVMLPRASRGVRLTPKGWELIWRISGPEAYDRDYVEEA